MNNISDEDQKEELKYDYEDVHNKDLDEIADDKVVEEKVEEKTEPPKEPEPPKEEVKVEEEPLSAEELADDIANKIAEKNKPVEVEQTEEEKYKAWAKDFEEENGRVPTWTDVASHLEETTLKKLEDREVEKQEQIKKEQQEREEIEKKKVEEFNKVVDEDLDDLYKNEKLTPIKDKDNPSDQGVLERKALFQAMLETNQERVKEGKRPIYSIKEIYYEHYSKPKAQPAGADAPISLGKGTSPSQGEEQEIDYVKDVHSKPWSFFKK